MKWPDKVYVSLHWEEPVGEHASLFFEDTDGFLLNFGPVEAFIDDAYGVLMTAIADFVGFDPWEDVDWNPFKLYITWRTADVVPAVPTA